MKDISIYEMGQTCRVPMTGINWTNPAECVTNQRSIQDNTLKKINNDNCLIFHFPFPLFLLFHTIQLRSQELAIKNSMAAEMGSNRPEEAKECARTH